VAQQRVGGGLSTRGACWAAMKALNSLCTSWENTSSEAHLDEQVWPYSKNRLAHSPYHKPHRASFQEHSPI
jgi:hypothetical protein